MAIPVTHVIFVSLSIVCSVTPLHDCTVIIISNIPSLNVVIFFDFSLTTRDEEKTKKK